jgi:curved DNA-binding protein CbpA
MTAQSNPLNLLDPYAELGVAPEAPQEAIREAYFALTRSAGPDRDPARFKRIRAAYEQLSDPRRRFETDMLRLQPWTPLLAPCQEEPATDWPGEALRAAKSLSDLERRHFREDCREVAP